MTRTSDHEVIERSIADLLGEFPRPGAADPTAFLGAQFDRGLAWVHFDPGCGGLGLPAGYQPDIDRRLREKGAPPSLGDYVGLHQGAAAIHAAATPGQRARFLRPIFTGEEHWCQLFSEPGAGSDLAGLSTTAVKAGKSGSSTVKKSGPAGPVRPGISSQPQMLAIRSRAMSIEGGTNEIQRNIIGERVLDLPGDIPVDKDRPWRDVPRN